MEDQMILVMAMVLHLYSAFSIWTYSNVLYNTLWGTLPDWFMAQFTISFNVKNRIYRCPQNRMSVMPLLQHKELHALLKPQNPNHSSKNPGKPQNLVIGVMTIQKTLIGFY